MILRQFIIVLIFLPTFLFGRPKYKYEYQVHLKDRPSTYSTQTTDTLLNGKCIIEFRVLDNKGDTIPFACIGIKSGTTDTLLHSDWNGFASITLPADSFEITTFAMLYTFLTTNKIYLKANSKCVFKDSLGKLNDLDVADIHCTRKLTEKEIEKIRDDLSDGKDVNDIIIEDAKFFVDWEI